jgi:flagellar basal-body rod protein FlgB
MDFSNISLFKLTGARFDYLAERQRLIAQNVVNANTPAYKVKDLKSFDTLFDGMKPVRLERTASAHLNGSGQTSSVGLDRRPIAWEISPDGNAVSLEQEMMKGSDTRDSFALASGVFQRNAQLLRAAWRAN